MRERKIKVVFFDAGGTLFRPYPSVGEIYAATAKKHGLDVTSERIEKLFHEAWHARNGLSALSGATSDKVERDWWYRLVKEVFAPFDPTPTRFNFEEFFADLYDLFARAECWRLFDDAVPALESVREMGIRIGMISNWDHRLFSIIEALGLSSYFEKVFASSAVGVAKPAPGIFHQALQAFAVEPDAALHIGDSLGDDYHGARAVGIQAILLDRHKRAYNGVMQIDSLRELPRHLR